MYTPHLTHHAIIIGPALNNTDDLVKVSKLRPIIPFLCENV
jgi:hypothetical protein